MFIALFGEFLLEKNYISVTQLRQAYGIVEHSRPKLGVLAVNEGLMTPAQVESVYAIQTMEDRRFGDIAMDMSYLSQENLDKLLSMQKRGHLMLGQALLDLNALSMETFNEALEKYKEEHHLGGETFGILTDDDVDVMVRFCLQGKDILEHELLTDYVSLFYRGMIRFVDRFSVLAPVFFEEEDLRGEYLALQLLTHNKDVSMLTAILGDPESLIALGRNYSEEDITSLDDLGKAAVEEFLNLINGLFSVNLSDRGEKFSMCPPIGCGALVLEGLQKQLFAVCFRFGTYSVKILVMDGVPDVVAERILAL